MQESITFDQYLQGKRVIIVGPAPTLTGSGLGKWIDGHDVIIRIKKAQVPPKLKPDYGSRTDVVYVTMQEWMFEPAWIADGAEWDRAGVKWVIYARRKKARHRYLLECGIEKYNYRRVPKATYARIRAGGGGTLPLAGNVMIGDVLRFGYRSIHLTGMTFYMTDHKMHAPGFQPPDIQEKWDDQAVLNRMLSAAPGSGSKHYIPPQISYISRMIRNESRCTVDPILKGVIDRYA